MAPVLKVCGVDNGFCRVDYSAKNKKNQMVHYCIQEEYDGVFVCYRSSDPPWCEPQSEVVCDKSQWEIPTGDSVIEKNVRDFLTEK